MEDGVADARRRLGKGFADAITASLVFFPAGLVLAIISALILLLVMPISVRWLPAGIGAVMLMLELALCHAGFILFLCGFIASAPSIPDRASNGMQMLKHGILPMAVLALAIELAMFMGAFFAIAIWAAATFFGAPVRFGRDGWHGWSVSGQHASLPAAQRIALIAPSAVLLGAVAWVLRGDVDFGLMDGGMFILPIVGAATFWASYSCALLSAQFAAPFKRAGTTAP